MKGIINFDINNKKILNLIHNLNSIGFVLCLFSFLFTYYYFTILNSSILNIGFFLFEAGLSLKIGTFISELILFRNNF